MNDLIDLKKRYASGSILKAEYIKSMYSSHRRLHDYPSLMAESNVKSIELTREGVVATLGDDEVKLFLIEGDERLAPLDALNFGGYEQEELSMMLKLTATAKVMLDVGANIGLYSINLSKRNAGLHIYAFEPLPRTFEYLNRNINLNGAERIKTLRMGLSEQVGEFRFYFDPELSVAASMRNVSGGDSVQEIVCPVDTIDGFVKREKLAVDFIKCDVEGAEFLVVKGAAELLETSKPVLFLEMLRKWAAKFNYHPNDIISFLRSKGYACYAIAGAGLVAVPVVNEETVHTNYVFLHEEKHKNLVQQLVG